ncbi:nucleoside-diphosphate sugar epimerase [Legionella beliardensis]|uniref:Nucleoside-diphosphate sugar epimerase n=1 Tax=Legionella beliardensis TaxID=91822 RepID=A0A378I5U6_9GAMM|nr:TIGR01777 family oxidoreductase [Legionella beliardensis]STX27844.1 nucleoside-diphosphate sugar epimerase [Legionella beliardensis]
MNILIAGASGFIGRHLVTALHAKYNITVLGRDKFKLKQAFPKTLTYLTWDELSQTSAQQYDIIINLCGHNIAASRWTNQVKQKIISSRVRTTTALIDWILATNAKPRLFVANAVGIYGTQNNDDATAFDEDSFIDMKHPRDFLSEVGIAWQQALQAAITHELKPVIMRFGVVLQKGEGILKKLDLSFKLGLGGIIGSGQQVISWVHIDDVIAAFLFLIEHPTLQGAFNITSPNPVKQKEFAKALAKSMHRPLLLTMPAFMIKALFGEMGEYLLLRGQRVLPKRLLAAGFNFSHPYIDEALQAD